MARLIELSDAGEGELRRGKLISLVLLVHQGGGGEVGLLGTLLTWVTLDAALL